MAVAYASQANTGWSTGTSATITKPSGLIEGDLMLHFCVTSGNNFAAISGFTAYPGFITPSGSAKATYLYYKYATAGDVAASDFSHTIDTGGELYYSILLRITGGTNLASNLVKSHTNTTNTATPSVTGLTPNSRGDSLLVQFWHGAPSVASIASYAIATSNPTWNEIVDAVSAGFGVGVAWALRPEVTATGNFSCAGGDASTDWTAAMVAIAPAWVTAQTDTNTVTDVVTFGTGVSQTDSIGVTDSLDANNAIQWTNQSKNPSNWINQNKN